VKKKEVCVLGKVDVKKGKAKEDRKLEWEPKVKKDVESEEAQPVMPHSKVPLLYNPMPEDLVWANGGMVARVVSGDSSLSLQQRVEDAGFTSVVVTPMGSDRVFLHCIGGEDIWKVFNDALHFFGMLFADLHKWSPQDDNYERGAWLRIYGTPMHAWNELFFKLCVSVCGRFIRSDDCTVDKARLDYARVLISTTQLEVVNTSTEIVIDGNKHVLKLVEEWGCNLGEDAFLSEEETVSPMEELINSNDRAGLDNINDNLDELVDDLKEDWLNNSSDQHVNFKQAENISQKHSLEEHVKQASISEDATVQLGGNSPKIIALDSKHIDTSLVGQCSLKDGRPKVSKSKSSSLSNNKMKKKDGAPLKYTAGFVKRIVRLPLVDRKEVLKVLKSKERKRSKLAKDSKSKANSLSNSSNMSNASVNNDWEHWVILHDKQEGAKEDVREIGKSLGVCFERGKKINLLTKEGRKELRAERGSMLAAGDVEDGGSGR
jgi:hypothetical protein